MVYALSFVVLFVIMHLHSITIVLGRPTYLADFCFTIIFFFNRLSFFRQLPSELAERNSTKIGQMLGSECDLKMHVRNVGYPSPLQIGAKTLFSTISQLTGNFNGLYLRNET